MIEKPNNMPGATLDSGSRRGSSPASRRRLAWVIGVVSLVMFVGGVALMKDRLVAFNKKSERPVFVFNELDEREFNWYGRPVRLEDADDDGNWTLVVTYGDQERRMRVTIPGDRRLPRLLPHRDWLRVLRFAEGTGLSWEELNRRLEEGKVEERLVLVTRIPRSDADPRTWGTAWVRDTSFKFYELMPDGTIQEQTLRFPTTKAREPYAEGELRENTWQLQAALRLVPPGLGPKLKYRQGSMLAMGYTWPMAMLGVAGMVVAVMIGGGARRTN